MFGEIKKMTTYLARRVRRYRRGHRLIVEPLEQRLLLAVCDPDADGEVTRSDAVLLASHYGLKEGASERLGDCNGDGAVNLFDVRALQDVFGVRSLDFGDAVGSTLSDAA